MGFAWMFKRLRLTGGTHGTDGSTYQTEIADFSNVTAHGTTGNGPSYFTVQGRNGLTYQCGYTDSNGNGVNSQVVLSGTAAKWLLSKVVDRASNNFVKPSAASSASPSSAIYTSKPTKRFRPMPPRPATTAPSSAGARKPPILEVGGISSTSLR
jgi:hypothetical protein